ncbi:MAG TPA: UbiD family decarboxylase [Alphaproteobacteria bacterium]|nr:UbiD family decarboxylase [Alphaproteobacteria bacterium]
MYASLREFIATLKREGLLLVVNREVDPKFELNAVLRKIQAGPNLPVLFERVRGSRFPVISNTLGNYSIIARLLGVEIGSVAARWAELARPSSSAILKEHAEEKAPLREISLSEIPHITYSEKDAGPYLTAGVIIARDPDTAVVNLSYHRMQIIGPHELRCRLSTSGDLYRIQQKAEKRNDALPAVVAIGLPPAVMLAGGSTIGPDQSEYDLAARISGKRFPLVPSPTLGLPVPDSTELVIEGKILSGVRRPEGPFGEWMDYYVRTTDNHVFQVEHAFARPDAVFYGLSAGSVEELAITAVPIAGSIYNSVRTWVPSIEDVSCLPLLQFCAIKINKQFEGQQNRAIVAAFGAEMNRVLYCVVVDPDVDIHNPEDVLWAIATRCRPDTGVFRIPNVPSFARDPHKIHWGRLGIDATKPLEHAADFERKRVPGLDDIKLEDYLGKIAT